MVKLPRGDSNEKSVDISLRGQAMRRAMQTELPKTLTPFEWEQWYAKHGVPDAHRKVRTAQNRKPWWRCKWLGTGGKET